MHSNLWCIQNPNVCKIQVRTLSYIYLKPTTRSHSYLLLIISSIHKHWIMCHVSLPYLMNSCMYTCTLPDYITCLNLSRLHYTLTRTFIHTMSLRITLTTVLLITLHSLPVVLCHVPVRFRLKHRKTRLEILHAYVPHTHVDEDFHACFFNRIQVCHACFNLFTVTILYKYNNNNTGELLYLFSYQLSSRNLQIIRVNFTCGKLSHVVFVRNTSDRSKVRDLSGRAREMYMYETRGV